LVWAVLRSNFEGAAIAEHDRVLQALLFSDYYFVDDHTVQEILCNSSDPYEL
jgi:hypothetical protein